MDLLSCLTGSSRRTDSGRIAAIRTPRRDVKFATVVCIRSRRFFDSFNPLISCASNRLTHLYPVCRRIPCCRQNSAHRASGLRRKEGTSFRLPRACARGYFLTPLRGWPRRCRAVPDRLVFVPRLAPESGQLWVSLASSRWVRLSSEQRSGSLPGRRPSPETATYDRLSS
jgi:hypothetical protein